MAEQIRRHSPYNYAFNNPLRFIDPDGMAPQVAFVHATPKHSDSEDPTQNEVATGQVVKGGYGEDIDIGSVWSHTEDGGYLSDKKSKKENTGEQNESNAKVHPDLLNSHASDGEELHTIDDFVSGNSGKLLSDIINQRKPQRMLGIPLASGGPIIRYVRDPQNPSVVIDLRHVLVVGSYWNWVGNFIERGQSAGGEKSAFDKQDYFSNNLGYEFTRHYGNQINQNPSKFADYLKEFLVNRSQNYYIYKLLSSE